MLDEPRYTTKEVATLYRVQARTVREWVKKGLLPVERVGKRIYIIAPQGRVRLKSKTE